MARKKATPKTKEEEYSPSESAYVTASEQKTKVFQSYGDVVDRFSGNVQGSWMPMTEPLPGMSVRAPFTRYDYDYFRPNEAVPRLFKDQVIACRNCYKYIGTVRNVIDLMIDFVCDGINVVYPDKKTQKFLRKWWEHAEVTEASNQFAKRLLLDCNVVAKSTTGTLTVPVKREWDSEIVADADVTIKVKKNSFGSKEIPVAFTFADIVGLEWMGGDAAKLVSHKQLKFKLPDKVKAMILNPVTEEDKQIVAKIPEDIKESVRKHQGYVLMDMEKVYCAFFKKDDFEDWATPYLVSVLSDIAFKQKLRQADTSALDGVINVIRLWKLGDHKEEIFPDAPVVNKLNEILKANTGGGALDIIWDSLIEMQEFYPPIDKILGSDKYNQVNRDILLGLGIPEVLLGGSGTNFSNSFIQLKTLIERLEYVREKLVDWLNIQLRIVTKAIGADKAPVVTFNYINLQDEATARKLILNLWDRGILSTETLLERYDENYEVEVGRKSSENKELKSAGIEIVSPIQPKLPGANENGRPSGAKDTGNRERRDARPRGINAIEQVWATNAVEEIDSFVTSAYLKTNNIKNARQITNDQRHEITSIRQLVLASLNKMDHVTEEKIVCILQNPSPDIAVMGSISESIKELRASLPSEPTVGDIKQIEATAYLKAK
jgi:hypothetical protein